ncbi:MAG: FAD-binding oxidoreductase [Verrucomicrobiota bacterium]|nr:FAD-binding oxidoreductase [Verrucomicrobiota bacterium]
MNLKRRAFLKSAGLFALYQSGCARFSKLSERTLVNDVHSQLNPTWVKRVVETDSLKSLQQVVREARRQHQAVCIAGGRHAMGAQQFASESVLIDTRKFNRILNFDHEAGIVEVEAGIHWPKLIADLVTRQAGQSRAWGIAQKQTGADRLSLGGALAANVHGRGLRMKPFVADVESLVVIDADGNSQICDRQRSSELFRLIGGGYGLFGLVYSLRLRLMPRQKVQRIVEIKMVEDLMPAFEKRIADGFLYGDFQFSIDEKTDDFLRRGVFSCYRPVAADTSIAIENKRLSSDNWMTLLILAHTDRRRVFEEYARYYLSTSGQVYWSDTHQLSGYQDGYHRILDQRSGATKLATEIITEIYVPRNQLADFLREARQDFRRHNVEIIYGTIRLIEQDNESFLAWAKQSYACIIFNIHTEHSPDSLRHCADALRRLIDMSIRRDGSYYLTYHKYATREQLLDCYPQFPEFLKLKTKYDPEERFQSDWYRHYRRMFFGR